MTLLQQISWGSHMHFTHVGQVGRYVCCMIWWHLRIPSIPFHHTLVEFSLSIVTVCLNHMSLNMMTMDSNPSKCNPPGRVLSCMICFHLRIPSIPFHHEVVDLSFSNVTVCLHHMSWNM